MPLLSLPGGWCTVALGTVTLDVDGALDGSGLSGLLIFGGEVFATGGAGFVPGGVVPVPGGCIFVAGGLEPAAGGVVFATGGAAFTPGFVVVPFL